MIRFVRKILTVRFFKNESNREPVREWLLALSKKDRAIVASDVKTIEFGWPIGMPVCRPLGEGLYEVRSDLSSHKIARLIFIIQKEKMILLHAFIKKTQKTPDNELMIARQRLRKLKDGK